MIKAKLDRILSDKLVKNIGWLTASQIFNRVTRLLTIVVLARKLTEGDYGIIAILFSITDLADIFIQKGGIAPKLIQADADEVEALANTAYWANWILCIGIFILQSLLAFVVADFYDNSKLIVPIIVMGLPYLLNPAYAVQNALIRRENRLKIEALAGSANAFTSQTLILVLALMNMGLWSVVIAKVVANLTWFWVFRKNHPWRVSQPFTLHRWQEIFNFSRFPLGIEMLNYLRSNIDYLLIGRFFSLEALGLYFFAFNAGLGVSLSAITMVSNSVFPYLCEARTSLSQLKDSYRRSLKIVAAIMLPIVILQSSLAPIYVPIIFGEKWIPAIPILILICLSGIPRAFWLVAEQLLITTDRGSAGLQWNLVFSLMFVLSIIAAAQFNIYTVAAVVLCLQVAFLPPFIIWTWQTTFPKVLPTPS